MYEYKNDFITYMDDCTVRLPAGGSGRFLLGALCAQEKEYNETDDNVGEKEEKDDDDDENLLEAYHIF